MLVAQLCPTLCDPLDCSPPGSSVHRILGKNTGVGSHALLQGIFLTQGSNPGLLHCRRILYCLSHLRSPHFIYVLSNSLMSSVQFKDAEYEVNVPSRAIIPINHFRTFLLSLPGFPFPVMVNSFHSPASVPAQLIYCPYRSIFSVGSI